LTALSAEFTIGEGELMAHDVPLGCAPDEYDDLISGTCSHLPKRNATDITSAGWRCKHLIRPTKPVPAIPVGLISAAPSGITTCPESKKPIKAGFHKE
ncbi:hypothetical protein, partial [Citrobacter freundii]|uniref:hypothetical protein n=1 Tax=Citrobacter freundii TaxID=546 RepID=UPI00387A06C0